MTYHIKESEEKSNFSFYYMHHVLALVFMLLFIYPLLPGGSEVNAQNDTDEVKADFLFQEPKKYLGFRIGMFFPEANSDLFDMITEELTLEKNDFRTWDIGIDFGYHMYERIDIILSIDYSKRTKDSEFRDYVDEQNLPITQSTKFSQTPLTVGIKYLLIPRGRKIGQYSWLPSRFVPYVTGGVGIMWYEFMQSGDFVDFSTLEIFSATLKSNGETATGYLGCGTEIYILKSAFLNLDFRYYWAEDSLGRDFVGFGPIDLDGYRLTTGIHWHF